MTVQPDQEAVMANATTIRVDHDLDAQSPAADLVRVYLNGIGKTALLNAADEVELAKRIETGLYAQHLLDSRKRLGENRKRDLAAVARDGEAARSHLLEANLRLVVSLAKRYTDAGYLVELQVRYHPAAGQEGNVAGFVGFVREVVDRFGPNPRVVGLQVTNEVNFTISPDSSASHFCVL